MSEGGWISGADGTQSFRCKVVVGEIGQDQCQSNFIAEEGLKCLG